MLENNKEAIKNRQSRDTGNKMKTNKTENTMQYVFDTTMASMLNIKFSKHCEYKTKRSMIKKFQSKDNLNNLFNTATYLCLSQAMI
jgi:phosphoribosylformylglycinamidine (FGAM) synthase-like enzyme